VNLTEPRDGRAVAGGTCQDWSRAPAINRDAAVQKSIAGQRMLHKDTGASLVQALSNPHAAADQPGSVNKTTYNQYGILVRVNAGERGIERF
jgi:hypothetical protein